MITLSLLLSFTSSPFNKEDYLTRFEPLHLTGDIKKADEPDADIDGFNLASSTTPLQSALTVAEKLVRVELKDAVCQDALIRWCGWMMKVGAEGKKVGEMMKTVLKAVKEENGLKAFAYVKTLEEEIGVNMEEMKSVLSDTTVESVKENADFSLVRSVIAFGEMDGVNGMMEKVQLVGRCDISEYAELYRAVKRLGGTESQQQVILEQAKQHYPSFDVYVKF